jgi:hypothetical protein
MVFTLAAMGRRETGVVYGGDWMICGGCANGVIEHACKVERIKDGRTGDRA